MLVVEFGNLADPLPAFLGDLLALPLEISLQLVFYLHCLLGLLQAALQLLEPHPVSLQCCLVRLEPLAQLLELTLVSLLSRPLYCLQLPNDVSLFLLIFVFSLFLGIRLILIALAELCFLLL